MEARKSKNIKCGKTIEFNRPLIPLKIAIFLYYGGWSLFFPYLTLHMVQVGLSIDDIAIIYAVLPFITCLGPPIAGFIADKFGKYKLVLTVAVTMAAALHTALLYVNPRTAEEILQDFSRKIQNPELSCSTQNGLKFKWSCNETTLTGMWNSTAIIDPKDCVSECSDPEFRVCSYASSQCSSVLEHSELSIDFNTEITLNYTSESRSCESEILLKDPESLTCGCDTKCSVKLEKFRPASVDNSESQISRGRFWVYFFIRIAASAALNIAISMMDATTICMVKKYEGTVGRQKICSAVGQVLFGVMGGPLLDLMVQLKGYQDFSIVFYVGDVVFAMVAFLTYRLDVSVEKIEGAVLGNLKKLIRLIDVSVYMVMMLFLGACWGFHEAYYFVFLTEIHADSILLGITVGMGCVFGLPFLYISDSIVKTLGEVNVIVMAFVTYFIRFMCFSYTWNPWLVLPLELCEAVTVHLMSVASALYCANAAPHGLLATLNGVSGAFYYSFGRGVGSFVGGKLMSQYGTRPAYRIIGTSAAVCGVVYFVLYRLFLRKLEIKRMNKKRKGEVQHESKDTKELESQLESFIAHNTIQQ